jgi:hypothetical protein
VAGVEVSGVLAADLDQPALTPLKISRKLAHLPVVGDQHLSASHRTSPPERIQVGRTFALRVTTAGCYLIAVATVLAATLRELGHYEPARKLGEDTLTRSRRVLGDDHLYTLISACGAGPARSAR